MIYASHVLEHINRNEVHEVLGNWYSMLKNGGVLRLSVPDFDSIVKIYGASKNDVESVAGYLMGGQRSNYDYHYNVFNENSLTKLLLDVGFSEVDKWVPENSHCKMPGDTSQLEIEIENQRITISLNLEAVK